jgi:hypothetical protein
MVKRLRTAPENAEMIQAVPKDVLDKKHPAAHSRQSPREPEETARSVVFFLITDDAGFISVV